MTHPLKCLTLALALALAWAGVARPARAAGVNDQANLFNAGVVSKANDQIAQLRQKYKQDLVIETYPAPPESIRTQAERDRGNEPALDKLFETWSDQRYHALGLSGVYVLISEKPNHLAVISPQESRAFTTSDRAQLRNLLREGLSAKKPDETLTRAVDWVGQTWARNGAGAAAAGSPAGSTSGSNAGSPAGTPGGAGGAPAGGFNWSILVWIGVAVVGIILLARMFGGSRNAAAQNPGGFAGGPNPPYDPGTGTSNPNRNYGPTSSAPAPGYNPNYAPPPQQAGPASSGGGFVRGALGGVVGGVAGSYLYDKLAHHEHGGAAASPAPTQGTQAPAGGQGDPALGAASGTWGDDSASSAPTAPSSSEASSNASSGSWGDNTGGGSSSGDAGGDFGGGGVESGPSDSGGGDSGGGDLGSSGGDF